MKINIRFFRETITIVANPSDTIQTIKEKIREETGIDGKFDIEISRVSLDPTRTLASYGITDGSNLTTAIAL